MKQITEFEILNIRMEGFKKFREPYELELDTLTYITGGNGQGKSTVADAVAFVFCGTTFWGEKNYDRLQNPESKRMRVDVRFRDSDGEIHTLSRERRGSDTDIMYDTVHIKQADIFEAFAEKDVFLSLLNPLYFIEKIASDGREFLQKLLPPISHTLVLEALSENTRKLLDGESVHDPEFYIKKRRAEIKDIDDDCSYLEGQVDLLEAQKKELESKVDAALEEGGKLVARRSELEEKQFRGLDMSALKAQHEKLAAAYGDGKRSELERRIAELRAGRYESKFTADLAKIKAEISALSEKYNSIVAQGKSVKVGDVCPTCRTTLSEQSCASIITYLRTELTKISELGNGAKAAYRELLEIDKQSEAKFLEFRAEDIKKLEEELNSLGETDGVSVVEVEKKLRLGNLTEEEYAELQGLIARADVYAKEVEKLSECEHMLHKIAKLRGDIRANGERKKKAQDAIYAAGEYAAKKAELTLDKLKMNRAEIKLHEVVKTTGEVKNVFKFTYDGKDYRWLSTSEKIKAGLEVSKLLASVTGLVYPTYIDNAECITTKLEPISGQVVLAYARNCEFAVHHPRRGPAQMKEAA